MRRTVAWMTMAAFAAAASGCGGKKSDEPNQGKTPPVVAGKTTPGGGTNGKTAGGGTNGKTAGGTIGKTTAGGAKKTNGGTIPSALKKSANPIASKYITGDFVAAVVARPGSILKSDLTKQLVKALAGVELEQALQTPIQQTGIDPRDIEQVILLVDEESARTAPEFFRPRRDIAPPDQKRPSRTDPGEATDKEPFGEPDSSRDNTVGNVSLLSLAQRPASIGPPERGPALGPTDRKFQPGRGPSPGEIPVSAAIVQFSKDMDFQALIKRLPSSEEKTHNGKAYRLVMREFAVHFPDNRTAIGGTEAVLKKMLDSTGANTPLTARLATLDATNDLVIAVNLLPHRKDLVAAIQQIAKNVPPLLSGVTQIPGKIKTVALTVSLTGEDLLTLRLQGDDAKAAQQFQLVIGALAAIGKQWYQGWSVATKEDKNTPQSVKDLLPVLDSLVEKSKTAASGDEFAIVIKRPDGFEKLPALLKPVIDATSTSSKKISSVRGRLEARNNLKQIALAMHNCHDAFRAFPSAGTDASGKQKGLSWRVHILQFIDRDLYGRFKLDEPWDSAHNKTLISRLPDVYRSPGVSEPGKTAIHVFVGEGAPFGGETPPRIRDIRDGTSNTILAVLAGPDTADIWTKPGGLKFDAANPLKALGRVGDSFPAAFLDGAVRTIRSNVDKSVLKALITHRGGETVPDGF